MSTCGRAGRKTERKNEGEKRGRKRRAKKEGNDEGEGEKESSACVNVVCRLTTYMEAWHSHTHNKMRGSHINLYLP